MGRFRRSGRISVAAIGFALLAGVDAHAEVARLVRWADSAQLAPLRGPGEPMFRLPAIVRWQPGILRDERKYQVEVRLPDGSVRVTALTPYERPGGTTLSALVPAAAVRNVAPDLVRVSVTLLDAATGAQASNTLLATIADFPAPSVSGGGDPGPFGYGKPLDPGDPSRRILRSPDPDVIDFIELPGASAASATFLARQEVSNRQVALHVPTFDPKTGRSDEFLLDEPSQPAVGLTPGVARDFLGMLSKAAGRGVAFRLPTDSEWLIAARAGSAGPFWWGDDPVHPPGANLLGPEPGRPEDRTAAVEGAATIEPNPWGFSNSFGNVAEWATSETVGFRRMGGHFRTEPDGRLDPIEVTDADQVGPDPYVGLRPAFTLDAASVVGSIKALFDQEPTLRNTLVTFDASLATATLEGSVPDAASRRRADSLVRSLWYVAALQNRLAPPRVPVGRLAALLDAAAPAERRRVLDRFEAIVPVRVLWAQELPVAGSEWWVNVQTVGGDWTSYRLSEDLVGRSIIPLVLPAGADGSVAALAGLSLGRPEPGLIGASTASDAIPVQLTDR